MPVTASTNPWFIPNNRRFVAAGTVPASISEPMNRGFIAAGSRRWRVSCACTAPLLSRGDGHNSDLGTKNSPMPIGVDSEVKRDTDVLFECRDVHKSFGEKQILRGLSFKIRHGEAVGIIGPSGSGKSTVLKIMAGLVAPDKGDVYICGKQRHGLVDDEEMSGLRIGLSMDWLDECQEKRMCIATGFCYLRHLQEESQRMQCSVETQASGSGFPRLTQMRYLRLWIASC